MSKSKKVAPTPAPVKKGTKKSVSKETAAKAKAAEKRSRPTPPSKSTKKIGGIPSGVHQPDHPARERKKFAGSDKSKPFVSMYRTEIAGGDPLMNGEAVMVSPVQKQQFPFVAVDPERHTAIVLSCVDNVYVVIPMSGEELKKVIFSKGIFEADDGYKPLNYDVRRAARKYLDHAKFAGITLDAERALCAITGDTPTRNVTESSDMPAKKKETEAAPTKGKKKPAEAAAPTKGKTKPEKNGGEEGGGRRGRPSPFAGKKIKVLSKETGARPGSKTDELRKLVLTSKTVEEAMGKKLADGEGPSVTTFRKMEAAKIIELV